MATYNGEKYIIQQLLSIVRQTLIPDEVIIVDDGSSDCTFSLIQEFIEKYKNMLKTCNKAQDIDRIKAINQRVLELQELLEEEK